MLFYLCLKKISISDPTFLTISYFILFIINKFLFFIEQGKHGVRKVIQKYFVAVKLLEPL